MAETQRAEAAKVELASTQKRVDTIKWELQKMLYSKREVVEQSQKMFTDLLAMFCDYKRQVDAMQKKLSPQQESMQGEQRNENRCRENRRNKN
jgi:hypothetical protein